MQKVYFNSFCPFEIGDKVKLNNSSYIYVIEDILAIHSVMTGKVTFRIIARNIFNNTIETEDSSNFTLVNIKDTNK